MSQSMLVNVCRTEATSDGRFVRVTFEPDSAPDIDLLIPRRQFESVVKTLQVQSDTLAGAPANAHDRLALDDFRLGPGVDDRFVLTLFGRLYRNDGEHGVTIPVELSPADAQRLRQRLDETLLVAE